MLGTVLYGPGDVRYEDVAEPTILKPTDAIIKLSATCVCGSDLWPYRGANPVTSPQHMGHEYCGVVVEVGSDVKTIKPDSSWSDRSPRPTMSAPTACMVSSPPARSASS